MRVIGGALGGRKIEAPAGIRPVSQRVKKSCFDIIAGQVYRKSVLDLFAGSGSLGIEALSRGAKRAVFIDCSKESIKAVEGNIKAFKIEKESSSYLSDSFAAVKDFYIKKLFFDFIFIDPPYNQGLFTKSLQLIKGYDILTPSGYLIGFCHKKENSISRCGCFSLILKRNYGQSALSIYRKQDSDEGNLSGDI